MRKDVGELMEQYKPLILSTYKKLHPMLNNKDDKDELMSEISQIFIKLVYEYNPRYGVDFPYYIKKMLNLRAWHYVSKVLKVKNKESIVEGLTNDEITLGNPEEAEDDSLERIVDMLSFDDNFKMGKKQKALFIGLLKDHKTLQELADEEGVSVSTLHTRLHFLIKKLKAQQKIQKEIEEKD